MTIFVCDVEADGPCPGLYSMVSFGLCRVDEDMSKPVTFGSGVLFPTGHRHILEASAISGVSKEEQLQGAPSCAVMEAAVKWVKENSPDGFSVFVSDNNGFDWQFWNYYCHLYCLENPFGFSSRRIGDFWSGQRDNWKDQNKWKSLRKTKHDHNPVNDAIGNAEALSVMLTGMLTGRELW